MVKKNPVVHFEMPYENAKRVSKFYSSVFGWEMNELGAEMGKYITAATTETDSKRMVKTPGTINGGFWPKDAPTPDKNPSVVISVDDIKEALKKIKEAGGVILGEPMEIPGVGIYSGFKDTEGNRVGLLQPLMK